MIVKALQFKHYQIKCKKKYKSIISKRYAHIEQE